MSALNAKEINGHINAFHHWKLGDPMARANSIVCMHPEIMNAYDLKNATSDEREKANDNYLLRSNAPANVADFRSEAAITTLTAIKSEIVKQEFYEAKPSKFMPVTTGVGAYSQQLLHYNQFKVASDFEEGLMNTGAHTKKAQVNTGYQPVLQKIVAWAKSLDYSIFDVQQINQSLVTMPQSKIALDEAFLKEEYDLGIQKVAFEGLATDPDVLGLLNQPSVTPNVALITKPISQMTPAEFTTVLSLIIKLFKDNAGYTITPDTLLISESDRAGLAIPYNDNFPGTGTSRLETLQTSLAAASGNPDFKIKAVQYCDENFNGLALNRYALYRSRVTDMEMNIPLPYTSTAFGTANNFDFNSVAFSQFTGLQLKRDAAMLYFDYLNV